MLNEKIHYNVKLALGNLVEIKIEHLLEIFDKIGWNKTTVLL